MSPLSPDAGRMLAADELDRLAHLLAERVEPNEGMSLEFLDGFLSALVVAPEAVPAAEYLPEIWGEGTPAWASPAEQDEAIALVEGLRRHILWRVQRAPDEVGDAAWPFMLLPPESDEGEVDPDWADFPAGAGWALGFLHGMSLREPAWAERIEQHEWLADDVDALLALAWLGDDEEGDDDLEDNDDVSADEEEADAPALLDLEQRLELVDALPEMLHDLHCLRIDEQRPAPARRTDEPGRNDLCPCGSGRKYKKCCGLKADAG